MNKKSFPNDLILSQIFKKNVYWDVISYLTVIHIKKSMRRANQKNCIENNMFALKIQCCAVQKSWAISNYLHFKFKVNPRNS